MMSYNFKQLLFLITPAIRRALYFDPLIYHTLTMGSLLLLVTRRVSVKSVVILLISAFVLGVIFFLGEIERYIKYVPLLLFCTIFRNFDSSIKKIRYDYFLYFFTLVSSVSIYQNYFGFFTYEIAYLNSGLGSIAAEGYLSHSDIRPFSLFSGLAEATMFYLFSAIYFMKQRKYVLVLIAVYIALISGSRGLLVGFVFSTIAMYVFDVRIRSRISHFIFSTVLGVLLFILITFFGSILSVIQNDFSNNRLLFYGSIKGRLFYLLEFISSLSLENLIVPVYLNHSIYDNIYVTLTNDFGFLISCLLLYFVHKILFQKGFWQRVFLATFVVYGFFADQILSIYLLTVVAIGFRLLSIHYPSMRNYK